MFRFWAFWSGKLDKENRIFTFLYYDLIKFYLQHTLKKKKKGKSHVEKVTATGETGTLGELN